MSVDRLCKQAARHGRLAKGCCILRSSARAHPGLVRIPECQTLKTLVQLLEAVRASGTAGDMPDKALKQMVLPFARTKMEEAVKGGAQVLHSHASSALMYQGVGSRGSGCTCTFALI